MRRRRPFYAAFADGDAFTFFVIVLATFHLGLHVSPSIVTPSRGAFDPERAIAAFVQGRSLRVDGSFDSKADPYDSPVSYQTIGKPVGALPATTQDHTGVVAAGGGGGFY